ncbi:MAG TPA: hypothetical protein VGB42_12355 [Candidatus Thermoplasmatota archaeon]
MSAGVLGLLLVVAVLPGPAAADGGLTVWVFVGPEDRGIGQTVDIHVESYLWGDPVDLELVEASLGLTGSIALPLTRTAEGQYDATRTIVAGDVTYGLMVVAVTGEFGTLVADASAYYFSSSASGGSGGWAVTLRMADFGQMPMGVLPGSTVTIEARSYNNGTLTEGAPMNGTIATYGPGGTTSPQALDGTKVADGVYRFQVEVPASLTTSTSYTFGVQAGPATDRVGETMSFYAQPFPFVVTVTEEMATSAVLEVVAGYDAPVVGAAVSVSGSTIVTTPPYIQVVGPFNGTTDARGFARIPVTWTGTPPTSLGVNLTSQGKTAATMVFLSGLSGLGPWEPEDNLPFGCSVALQTDPRDVEPGGTAQLKYRVTEDGDPVASAEVTVFVREQSASGMESAGNLTTDASGNLTVAYDVDASWNFYEDALVVDVLCPSGEGAAASDDLGEPGSTFSTDHVTLTATGTAERGGAVQVTATYTGPLPLDGAYGFAMLARGDNPQQAVGSLGGNFGGSVLTAGAGGAFTGTVQVPEHWQEGNYTLIVFITNHGAVSQRSNEFQEGGLQTVHVVAPGAGPPTTGGGGGFLPGFEGAVAALALVGAAAGLVGRRRPRTP